ncbi:cystathionine gamma-lyase [Jannaschia aquimarina]|uniref:MccB protein n=1 Tax=Jannaschia aquimarina TaxID=935700 RepID=A0A0D1EIT7_9RHOB|nr:cystathionine gamma-lyase [Jannaschia aquimarina]KIT17549.1 Cystathionine gamma-lyase [Jannaschia aquimarina]SNS73126.1 cystathionine gamma-lyase [Jannaschia aquimarina]
MTDPIQAAAMALLHHRTSRLAEGDPVAEPMLTTATFRLGDQPAQDAIYGRYATPTVTACEGRLSEIEGAPALLFASGMAAIAAVMLATCRAGDRILLPADGYFHTRVLGGEMLAGMGIETVEVQTRDLGDADLAGIRLAMIETPSNPALDLVDLAAFSARTREAGALLAVDNTFATGFLQRPLELGADIVVASDTKAAGGHSDLILGHVATRDEALHDRLADVRKFAGSIPGPFEAWLLSRSLETLELRLERMCANAAAVAARLAAADLAVTYPGRPDHPDHALAATQMRAPGFVIGTDFGSKAAAERFIAASGAILSATSFGSTHTSADRRARWGDAVPEGYLRLSVGIEPQAPLLDAIGRGLAAI